MEFNLFNIFLFSIAGACGTLARYGLSSAIQKLTAASFPWGIFTVNILGCLLFGFFWGAGEHLLALSIAEKNAILIGFLGAFTTFSTLIFDCHVLINSGRWFALAGNILGQIVLGLASFALAMKFYG